MAALESVTLEIDAHLQAEWDSVSLSKSSGGCKTPTQACSREGSSGSLVSTLNSKCISTEKSSDPANARAMKCATGSRSALVSCEMQSRYGVIEDEDGGIGGGDSFKTVNQRQSNTPASHVVGSHPSCSRTLLFVISLLLLPNVGAAIWFGMIPIEGIDILFDKQALWIFVVNPGVHLLVSMAVITIFLGDIGDDSALPHAGFTISVLVVNYLLQVTVLVSIFLCGFENIKLLGLAPMLVSVVTTMLGLWIAPLKSVGWNSPNQAAKFFQLTRILGGFVILYIILVVYLVGNSQANGYYQCLFTIALFILTFNIKRPYASLAGCFPDEKAIVVSGLWLENLVDIFMSLAIPEATGSFCTLSVILWVRLMDVGFLAPQTRVWLASWGGYRQKQALKPEKKPGSDLERCSTWNGGQFSNNQEVNACFFLFKLCSLLISSVFIFVMFPVLRFGGNRMYYPFGEDRNSVDLIVNKNALHPFTWDDFQKSMFFAGLQFLSVLGLWLLCFAWMCRCQSDTIHAAMNDFGKWVTSNGGFLVVLLIFASNTFLGVSAIQLPNHLYYF